SVILARRPVSVILARRSPRSGGQPGPGALRAPLKTYGKFSPIRARQRVLSRLMLEDVWKVLTDTGSATCAVPFDARPLWLRLMLDTPAHAVGVERGRAEMPRCAGSRYRCPGLSSPRSILPVILPATAVLSG